MSYQLTPFQSMILDCVVFCRFIGRIETSFEQNKVSDTLIPILRNLLYENVSEERSEKTIGEIINNLSNIPLKTGTVFSDVFLPVLSLEKSDAEYIKNRQTICTPPVLQALLYVLLVIPKECMSSKNKTLSQIQFCNQKEIDFFEDSYKKLNPDIDEWICLSSLTQPSSTYKESKDFNIQSNGTIYSGIDYIRHIRNALAHSSIEYLPKTQAKSSGPIFTFRDTDGKNTCEIVLNVSIIQNIFIKLDSINMEYITRFVTKK